MNNDNDKTRSFLSQSILDADTADDIARAAPQLAETDERVISELSQIRFLLGRLGINTGAIADSLRAHPQLLAALAETRRANPDHEVQVTGPAELTVTLDEVSTALGELGDLHVGESRPVFAARVRSLRVRFDAWRNP